MRVLLFIYLESCFGHMVSLICCGGVNADFVDHCTFLHFLLYSMTLPTTERDGVKLSIASGSHIVHISSTMMELEAIRVIVVVKGKST